MKFFGLVVCQQPGESSRKRLNGLSELPVDNIWQILKSYFVLPHSLEIILISLSSPLCIQLRSVLPSYQHKHDTIAVPATDRNVMR